LEIAGQLETEELLSSCRNRKKEQVYTLQLKGAGMTPFSAEQMV
jgi:uncharacterized protein YdiU (UPF0061 family)